MAIRADDVDLRRDRDLVERFQDGDPLAFAELYERYFDRLARFCRRRVFDRDVAEELAQEAFYRALRAMPTFGGERRFYPWLTVVAGRLCVDHGRARARVEPRPEIDAGSVPGADAPVVERAALDLLDSALTRVKPRHREVLTLRDEGLSYQAIGERIDAPVTTVETLLHRARKALRREVTVAAGPGAWAAVPGLMWLRRAAVRLRTRAGVHQGEWSMLGAPLAAAAVSVALAVAPPPDGGGPRVDAGRPTPVREPEPPVTPPPDTPVRDVEAPVVPPVDAAPAPPAAEPVAPVEVGPVRVFLGPDGADAAAGESERLPVSEQVGPAFVGADPSTIVEDAEEVEDVEGIGALVELLIGGE